MTPLDLALTAALFCTISGLASLSRRVPLFIGRKVAFGFMLLAALAGLAAVFRTLSGSAPPETIEIIWHIPIGTLLFRLDNLSAFFLIPILVVAACIALYGCGYCATTPQNRQESQITFFFGLTVASIVMLVLSAGGITLLICWEAMSLMSFLTMCLAEHGKQQVREAGLQFLVASHLTVLALFVAFSLLPHDAGAAFPGIGTLDPAAPASRLILLAALIGFGTKAGIMPLHVWLPTAHANAPSHISALMSGIILKMGIYGILRTLSFFGTPPLWWGIMLLCLGIASAVAGVLFAIGQHDIKRLLAYHSIENIGIIVMGIGVALIGLTSGNRILFVLGMAGALLHVLNHALFKSLLFLGSGAIIHLSGTRDIDRMGGLSRSLPLTSAAFLIGSAAICGLPPLNGFVSEFLIYLGIFKGFGVSSGGADPLLALAAPALALTGGLALACFVKVFGSIFLGTPRTILPPPHEHPAMNGAMIALAGLCILIGTLPFLTAGVLEPVIASLFPQPGTLLPSIQTTAHLYGLSVSAAILVLLAILLVAWYVGRLKTTPVTTTGTWDCGYAAPSASMQYTASSFAEMLVKIFSVILRPERHEPDISQLFPGKTEFHSHVPEVTLDRGILPLLAAVDRRLAVIRRLQNGQLNRYLLYIFVALIVLLTISNYF